MLFTLLGLNVAQAGDLDQYLGEIEKKYKDVTALQASFKQETSNEFLPAPFVQEGELSISKPSLLHWAFRSPMEQHYYADAEKITVWTPSQNQALISSNQEQSEQLTSILTDLSSLKEKFNIQLVDEKEDRLHFSLQSEKLDGKIQLWFSQKEYVLQEVLVETSQATTKLSFAEMTLNPTFEKNEFIFEPKPDTDIIDSRQ